MAALEVSVHILCCPKRLDLLPCFNLVQLINNYIEKTETADQNTSKNIIIYV